MVGDTIKLSFYVKDAYKEDWSDDDIRPFSHYAFEVTEQGFKTISGQVSEEMLEDVVTWQAKMTAMELNYIEDGTLGMSSLSHNKKLEKQAAQKKQQAESGEK